METPPNPETPQAFLLKELQRLLDNFESDRERHKRSALWLRMTTTALASMATILLGLSWPDAEHTLRNIALVCNATITLMAAYELFYEPKRLWVRETQVYSHLKDIQRDLLFDISCGRPLPEARCLQYKDRISAALNSSLDDWIKSKQAER